MKFVWLISIILLFGCSRHIEQIEAPNDVIPQEKMVLLITELTKLESHVQTKYERVDRFHKIMSNSGDSLLNAHGYNFDQFDRSMKYYATSQEDMISIYDQALDELNRELGELEK